MRVTTRFALLGVWCLGSLLLGQAALAEGGGGGASPMARRRVAAARRAQYRERAIADVRGVLEDPNATPDKKADRLCIIGQEDLREFKPQVERLAREDPSELVRKNAKVVLEGWRFRDAEAAELKAKEDAIRGAAAMTPEQRERQRQEGERQFTLMIRDQILQKLQSKKEEDVRDIMGSAQTWAKHLPETWPRLRDILRTDPNPSVRLFALIALRRAQGEGPESLTLLRECVAPEYPSNVRALAAAHLCELGDKTGLDVLIGQLGVDNVYFQAHTMKLLRGVAMKGDIGPPASVLTKAEKPCQELSDEEKRQIREGAGAWQAWWRQERDSFVLPCARATQPSTRPATRPGR
jgi:hypothetical protein